MIDHTLTILQAFDVDPSNASRFACPFVSDDIMREAKRFYDKTASSGLKIGVNLSAGCALAFLGSREIDGIDPSHSQRVRSMHHIYYHRSA